MASRASPIPPSSPAAPTPESIDYAGALIRTGGLVAFPTETVYGLGGDATRDHAVAAIFAAKARPSINPLIVHVADAEQAAAYATLDEQAAALARAFWPGPLTLVLPRRQDCAVSRLASAGLDTVAIRAPAHPVARALIASAGVPIAAPSANPSGRLSPTLARHVADELNGVFVIDGGPTTHGLESTVVDTTGPVPMLLRAGALDRAAIESMVGPLANPVEGAPRSPGMLTRHYAPRRPLRLNVEEVRPGETLLAFGPAPPAAATMRNLSPRGDLVEAAANLFAMLHELEQVQCTAIAVMPIPNHGLGEAINDRLTRAAQGL